MEQQFARKLVHIPGIDTKVIENEVEAILKLCRDGGHLHIVTVMRIGDIPPFLFIDMELCDLNLADYIYCTKDRASVPTYFIKDQSPPMKSCQIWNVMLQIAKGVEFLHVRKMVHRDLKPLNSNLLVVSV